MTLDLLNQEYDSREVTSDRQAIWFHLAPDMDAVQLFPVVEPSCEIIKKYK